MRGRGRSSGGGSSGKSAPKETPKEKPKQKPQERSSSDDSDESGTQQILKKRTDKPVSREISCVDAAREEVECLMSVPEPKRHAQKKAGQQVSAPPRTTCEERQRVLEQNRKEKGCRGSTKDRRCPKRKGNIGRRKPKTESPA